MAGNEVTVFIEHIRCFAEAQSIPIRPLTLLVGENSSGKSTFLAAASALFERDRFPLRPSFNEPPFNLGNFETIATYKGGKYGRDESFTIGFSSGMEGEQNYCEVKGTYVRDRGKPALSRLHAKSSLGSIEIEVTDDKISVNVTIQSSKVTTPVSVRIQDVSDAHEKLSQILLAGDLSTLLIILAHRNHEEMGGDIFDGIWKLSRSLRQPFAQTFALAPIRTRPKRTYDELSEDYSPEGDHVPKLLARLLNEEPRSEPARRVREAILKFGKESGLFRDVEVKKLGKGSDDPFQVQIGVGGPKVNLIDVGYGVSQSLPVIVQSVLRRQDSLLLIQQPEVHLHPRAQAALGTFFAELATTGKDTLLIETHSDYLIDRVRQEVAKGTLDPNMVLILFFDKPRIETTVFPIHLDRLGNVENAPDHYRDFFLKEELNILGQTRE
jgi:energy-coupling factor transporter ATP-binding protein EcfA2